MAITFDGTNGLFTRLGKLAGLAEAVRLHQSDIKTRIAGIMAEYSSADAYMVADLAASIDAKLAQAGSILADIQAAAETTLIETCVADSAISSTGILEARDVQSALLYTIRAMKAQSETVQETTVKKAAVSAIAGNTGNGTVLYSNIPPLALQSASASFPNVRSERLEVRCIEDAQSKFIRAGSERFQVRGLPAYPNVDYRFPGGSGTRMEMRSVDPAAGVGARYENLARNGGFEQFTSNVPDYWTVNVGTAGTHFASESTVVNRGSFAFRFIGNGATLASIEQKLADDTGTPLSLVSDRLYCLAVIARMSAGASAGVVRVSVMNTTTSTPVSGATFNISYTIGTAYVWSHVFFRAPLSLPNAMSIRIEQTTAINSGATMYLDSVVLCEAQQIAPGGTGIVIVPGSANWVVNDALIIQNTNNAEGEWNTEVDRLFAMYERGLLLPSAASGSETILDSLIS
jgi:hypothetical protein